MNKYKVPKKIWNRWTPEARRLFNELYAVTAQQKAFSHPKAVRLPKAQWQTIQWNTAWMAADMLSNRTKASSYQFEAA